MAVIDILNIKPHRISRDMVGKTLLFYGNPKIGKTDVACQFPKPILMGFEKGFGLINGIKPVAINSWSEAVAAKNQLVRIKRDYDAGKSKELVYQTIVIDTVDAMWDQCERFVAAQADVQFVDEMAYGKGTSRTIKLFSEYLQDLARAGYGMVLISHSVTKPTVVGQGVEMLKTMPSLQRKGAEFVMGLVDLVGYVYTDWTDGKAELKLRCRELETIEAGTRLAYFPDVIPYTYEDLRDNFMQAIDRINAESGAEDAELAENPYAEKNTTSFADLMQQVGVFAKTLRQGNYQNEYQNIVEKYLGKGKLAKDCTEAQIDILRVIHDELEMLIADLGLVPAA